MKKIFLLLGHENKETLSGVLTSEYERGAKESGHEVRRMNIGDLKFDPFLHKGYHVIQELEPDLKQFEENVRWADHIVIVHPVWFSMVPALLKGLFDRVWLPAFAYHYYKNGMGWKKLLKGRSARLIMLQNSPSIVSWMLFGDNSSFLRKAILRFAGISPVYVTRLTRSEKMNDNKVNRWKNKIYKFGKKGK